MIEFKWPRVTWTNFAPPGWIRFQTYSISSSEEMWFCGNTHRVSSVGFKRTIKIEKKAKAQQFCKFGLFFKRILISIKQFKNIRQAHPSLVGVLIAMSFSFLPRIGSFYPTIYPLRSTFSPLCENVFLTYRPDLRCRKHTKKNNERGEKLQYFFRAIGYIYEFFLCTKLKYDSFIRYRSRIGV